MEKDPKIFLLHVLENISLVENDLKEISEDVFKRNKTLQDATMRRIEVIGEAVKNLPDVFKKSHPEVPWREIASTRDYVIHEYFSIDLDTVWEITQKDFPDLKLKIGKILNNLS